VIVRPGVVHSYRLAQFLYDIEDHHTTKKTGAKAMSDYQQVIAALRLSYNREKAESNCYIQIYLDVSRETLTTFYCSVFLSNVSFNVLRCG